MNNKTNIKQGGCACGLVRYELISDPLIVHCCHCTYCQRQTGSAFVINALYQTEKVKLLSGTVNEIETPSPSGKGQIVARCPECQVAVWSHYYMSGIKNKVSFVRVGTLDNPELLPPDVHIFTETKQPWLSLPPETLAVKVYYDYETTWSLENQMIRTKLLEKSKH